MTMDVYVLGYASMDLMKGTEYTVYDDLIMLGLHQMICEVTRPQSKSCLDLVYVNNRTNVVTSSSGLGSLSNDLLLET